MADSVLNGNKLMLALVGLVATGLVSIFGALWAKTERQEGRLNMIETRLAGMDEQMHQVDGLATETRRVQTERALNMGEVLNRMNLTEAHLRYAQERTAEHSGQIDRLNQTLIELMRRLLGTSMPPPPQNDPGEWPFR